MKLLRAAYHLGRGRKLRKYIQDKKIVIDLREDRAERENDAIANAPPVDHLAHKILRQSPLVPDTPICLFVSYSADGRLWPHVQEYLRRIRNQGIYVVLIVATDRSDLNIDDPGPARADAVLVKKNGGFDFCCWALALQLLPSLWRADTLFFANDSVYGPFKSFETVIGQILSSDCDVIGLTDCDEIQYHFQSYFFALKNKALNCPHIRRFWKNVRCLATKEMVIRHYETRLAYIAGQAGLKLQILFPTATQSGAPRLNPTYFEWRQLVERGFPFIKVNLLRDNIAKESLSGWRELLLEHGGDVDLVALHLTSVNPGATALKS